MYLRNGVFRFNSLSLRGDNVSFKIQWERIVLTNLYNNMENNTELIKQCELKAKEWLSPAFDADTRAAVSEMLEKEDKTDLIECFYKNLEFGTGGLRGIMGAGSNRMNIYTVGLATQGLANYLKKNFAGMEQISVVVCHDCRNNSRLFAETVADIFSANDIKVYLFDDMRHTPECSFAIRLSLIHI